MLTTRHDRVDGLLRQPLRRAMATRGWGKSGIPMAMRQLCLLRGMRAGDYDGMIGLRVKLGSSGANELSDHTRALRGMLMGEELV